jgi:hypothetical protein
MSSKALELEAARVERHTRTVAIRRSRSSSLTLAWPTRHLTRPAGLGCVALYPVFVAIVLAALRWTPRPATAPDHPEASRLPRG